MKFLSLNVVLILLSSIASFAQDGHFNFKRKVNGVEKEGWYSIPLSADQFIHTDPNFNDVRLYSLVDKDTTEIPYFLEIRTTQVKRADISLSSINKSKKDGRLFITFEVPNEQKVNYIDLDFSETNFFAFVKIEGSHNQKEWFEVTDEQRIFSIQNSHESYSNGVVTFPLSNYRYLRVSVKSDLPLTFVDATFQNQEVKEGTFQPVPVKFDSQNDKKSKQTVVTIKLDHFRPVSLLALDLDKQRDFYRTITIASLADSSKTEKGWVKYYQTIYNGYVSSYQDNSFDLGFHLTKELQFTIHNYDNSPLTVNNVSVAGATVELKAQLKPVDTYLFYGNKTLQRPSYDLDYFVEKIPADVPSVSLGPEESMIVAATPVNAIFENKVWLWVIMITIIAVLGFFTLRMMSSKESTA